MRKSSTPDPVAQQAETDLAVVIRPGVEPGPPIRGEELLAQFLEEVPVSVAMFDREMRYLAASGRWKTDYGLPQDVVGHTVYDICPELPPKWREAHLLGLAGQSVRQEEDRFERANGTVQWVTWELRPWHTATGEIGGILIAAEEVTDRVRVRLALQESEARLAGIINTATDAIICIDESQKVVLFNPAAENMFGRTADSVIGTPVHRLIPSRFRAAHVASIEEFGVADETNRVMGALDSLVGRRANGEEFPIEASISHVRPGGSRLFTAIVRDVTARRQSERAIRRQTEVLTETLHTLTSAASPESIVQSVLTAAMQALEGEVAVAGLYEGESEPFALKAVWKDAAAVAALPYPTGVPDHPAAEFPIWDELRRAGRVLTFANPGDDPRFATAPWLRSYGIRRTIAVALTSNHAPTGFLTVHSVSVNDFSAEDIALFEALATQASLALVLLKMGEERRSAALLQERHRFAQDIHDTLAQGLTGIRMHLEAARDALDRSPEQATSHVERASDLARSCLVDARRSVQGLRSIGLDTVELPAALRQFVTSMSEKLQVRIDFEVRGAPAALPTGTESALYRIAQEAVTNALKHANASSIDVRLTYSPRRVQLRIQDDGLGYRMKDTLLTKGFGLIGMYERTRQIGGVIRVNTSPGRGTRITVDVPVRPLAEPGDGE